MLTIWTKPRWMVRRDLAAVVAIDCQGFGEPWKKRDFETCLKHRDTIGVIGRVIENRNGEPVAYSLYRLHPRHIELLRFAVRADQRRRGLALELLDELTAKLSPPKGKVRVLAEVCETNLAAQLLFKAAGWEAINYAAQVIRFAGYPPARTEE